MIRLRTLLLPLAVLAAGALPPTLAATGASAAPTASAAHAAHAVLADVIPDPDPVLIEPDITATPMCLTSSPNYCAHWHDAQNFIWDGAAGGGPGPDWNIKFNRNGNTFTWNGHTYNVGTLNMPGHSPACLGVNNGAGYPTIQLQNCSTGYGIIWGHGTSGGHDVWINRKDTQVISSLRVLISTAGCFCGFGPLASGDWYNSALYRKWSF
jgi:hypothetical protein